MMEAQKQKNVPLLQIKATTWFKDSHSLFDYESNKVDNVNHYFPITTNAVALYRKRQTSSVLAFDVKAAQNIDLEEYQLLTRFEIKHNPTTNKIKLEFDNGNSPRLHKFSSERLKTDQSISSYCGKEEETYIIVRKIKDINHEQKGYRLAAGQTIKIGRVEFFVSEVKEGNNINFAVNRKNNIGNNRAIMKYQPTKSEEKNACKICLEEKQTKENFFINPCLCSGSCGTVHIDCLSQWIHFKVKKEIIGGTLHFNFSKFQCEVCKQELPMIIDVEGEHKELLPIDKPEGNYLILEGACEKTKSVMMIQNVASGGIKLGRGHDCEIRITDISVSRNHALIKNVGNSFYIFDSKSKFGTLVKEDPLTLEIGRLPRGVQVGRTMLNFQMKKNVAREVKTEQSFRPRLLE